MKPDRDLTTTVPSLELPVNSEEVPAANAHTWKVLRKWNRGFFRFRWQAFLPGKNFSERRFSITEAALLLMVAYITSRGFGVVRQSIFNALFGAGPEANAYYAASRLPDTLFNLIAGGALTHAFIPTFVSYEKEHGKAEAWRLTSLLFNVLFVLLTALVLLGEIFAPAFVNNLLVPGYPASEQALTTTLTRILLLQPLILGLSTIATAVLTSKHQFVLPALSIAFYNIALILGLVVSVYIPGIGIYGPTIGVLVASIFQGAIQVPGLLKEGAHYSFIWDLKHQGLRDIMRLLGPNALAIGLVYISFIVDTAVTSYLPDQASLAALHNAQMLVALLLSLLAQALSQAILPQMSLQAASRRFVRLRQTVIKVIVGSLVLSIPATIFLCLIGRPLIRILFQHGAFTSHVSDLTFMALLGFCVLLPGQIVDELLVRGFYALKDARTPLFTNALSLGLHCGMIFLGLTVLTGQNAILAIPFATCGAATLEAILLGWLLFARLRREIKQDAAMIRLYRRRKARVLATSEVLSN